jgi:hypothetical protein
LKEELRLSVFENRLLKRIFKPKGDEGTGEWRRLLNEKLNDLYCCSPNVIQVIKSKRMGWVGACSTYGGGERLHTGFWWGDLRERNHLEDPGVDGRVMFSGRGMGARTGLIWRRIGTGGLHW